MKIADQCKEGKHNHYNYYPKQKWGDDVLVQWGKGGIVLGKGIVDAFFEAFSDKISFIRGEGKDLEEAELNTFKEYEKIMNCQEHEWDRRGRTDGYAYCKNCELSMTVLEPLTKCNECGIPTAWSSKEVDGKKVYICKLHDSSYRTLNSMESFEIIVLMKQKKLKCIKNDVYADWIIKQLYYEIKVDDTPLGFTLRYIDFWYKEDQDGKIHETIFRERIDEVKIDYNDINDVFKKLLPFK